jgi:hypothetical protein
LLQRNVQHLFRLKGAGARNQIRRISLSHWERGISVGIAAYL